MSGTARRATAASSRSGCAKRGPSPSAKRQAEAHRVGHGEDVAEQDRGVERISRQRLQRHLGREVRVRRQAHEAAGAARASPGIRAGRRPAWRISQTGVYGVGSRQAGAQEACRSAAAQASAIVANRRDARRPTHNRRGQHRRVLETPMLANDVLHTIGNTPHIRINRLFGDEPQRLHQERALATPAARSRTASRCR